MALNKLPPGFKLSTKSVEGITNCANILNQTDLNKIKNLEYEINQVGYNANLYEYVQSLSPEDTLLLVTLALPAAYIEIELRESP